MIVKSGKSSNGNFWALVEKEESGFIMNGFLKRRSEEFAEGEEIEVPTPVVNAIEWRA